MYTEISPMPHHENIFPAPDTLNEMECGKFVLANLAAKRAKQIKDGAPPLVRIQSNHPLSIALAEIAAGKIKPILASEQAVPVEAHDNLVTLGSLDLGDDGLLLPAFDEDEALGIGGLGDVIFGDDELADEDEEDVVEGLASLLDDEDVVVEDDDVAVPAATGDDNEEISLDDLASEEAAEEEGDQEDA